MCFIMLTVAMTVGFSRLFFPKPYVLESSKWLLLELYIVQPIVVSILMMKIRKVWVYFTINGLAVSLTLRAVVIFLERYRPTNCPSPSWSFECGVEVSDPNYLIGYAIAAIIGGVIAQAIVSKTLKFQLN